MSAEIDFLIATIPVFLSIFIPGFFLALALLRKTKLSLFEIAGFGFILGLIIPPTLLFIYSLIGIKFSFEIMIFNFIAITIIGLILCLKENVFPLKFSFYYKRDAVWILLLLVMLFAFWVRIQSIGPIFYEFDPYFYDQVTQFILTRGEVPLHDDLAWYPYLDSHRVPPITNYLEAQWYTIYQYVAGVRGFDNYLLATIAGVYPPVVGALLAFLFFILFSEEYGKRYGLLSAVLVSIIPRAIEKFAAGESEQQPWGIFAAFFFYAAYALAITKGEKRFAILAGIAAIGATLGSKGDVLVYLVIAGYTIVQSIINFLTRRSNKELVEINLIIISFAISASLILQSYLNSWDIPSDILTTASVTAVALVLLLIDEKVESKRRLDYFIGFSFLSIIIFFITFIPGFPIPVGSKILGYVTNAASMALPSSPLMMTVAEETPTQGEFAGSVGFFGTPLGELSLMHIILIASALCILYAIYRGSKLALLLGATIFPVSYIGAGIPGLFPGKSKYMLHASFMVVGAVVVIFGEVEKLLLSLSKDPEIKRYVKYSVSALAVLTLLIEAFVYPPFVIGGPVGDVVFGTFPIISSKYHSPDPSNPNNTIYNCDGLIEDQKIISYYLYCSRIPDWWLEPMNWIKNNVAEDDRVIHWWDYGHWTNYFGQRKTITRNDHQHQDLDLEVANNFVHASPEELKQWMVEHKAKYVLFDQDLIGKWGALDFLSCVYNNETNMSFAYSEGKKVGTLYNLGTSRCEQEHNFERIFIPVSDLSALDYCQSPDPNTPLIRAYSNFGYKYCIPLNGSGEPVMLYEDNLSRINKGHLASPSSVTLNDGRDYNTYLILYTYETWSDGRISYEDRKGKMYDSNFYKGFFLGELPGFIQVYPSNMMAGPVRIFKIVGS